jgi:transcriptional antiterminator NusG
MASTSIPGARAWFALRSAHEPEIALRDALLARQVEAVVPVKKTLMHRRGGNRCKLIHRPVVRERVFVRLVPSAEAFAGLLRVRGVASIIGANERPYPIGDMEMNTFMHLADDGAFDDNVSAQRIALGSHVQMKVGAFADMRGVLTGYVGTRGARVETFLFGGTVTVDVTLAQVTNLV